VKKKVTKKMATASYEVKGLALTISNENGVHTHTRNGEVFRGKQKACPLCANGSEFEKLMGTIAAD
jgi:hypothetical protein